MLNQLLDFQASPLFTFLAIVVISSWFGYFLNNKVKPEYKKLVSEKIKQTVQLDKTANFTCLFLRLFDQLILPSTAQRPNICRSILVSMTTLAFVGLVWATTSTLFNKSFQSFVSDPWGNTVIFLVLGTIINIIGDYFSLRESRLVIGMLPRVNLIYRPMLIMLDLVFTVVCFLASCLLGLYLLHALGISFGDPDPLSLSRIILLEGIFFSTNSRLVVHLLGIYFWTTLFSSVWLWIFVAGSMFWPLVKWTRRFIDIDKHPIGTVMTVGGIFIGMVFLVATVAQELLAVVIREMAP